MKKTIFTSSVIALVAILACSNKKDAQPAPNKSVRDYLTAHPWKVEYAIEKNGDTIRPRECFLDNTATFKPDGVYIYDSHVICDSQEIGYRDGSWKYSDKDSIFIVTLNLIPDPHTDTVKVLSINDDIFLMQRIDNDQIAKYKK